MVYRLSELHGPGRVFFAEGEKDANALAALGLPSTTTPGGAAAWRDDYADQLAAAGVNEVIVLPDNDGPGREYATTVAAALTARGIRVRVLALPGLAEKGDVSDWIAAGGTADALKLLVDEVPTFGVGELLALADTTAWPDPKPADDEATGRSAWHGKLPRDVSRNGRCGARSARSDPAVSRPLDAGHYPAAAGAQL